LNFLDGDRLGSDDDTFSFGIAKDVSPKSEEKEEDPGNEGWTKTIPDRWSENAVPQKG
jgi:hypothetical protein